MRNWLLYLDYFSMWEAGIYHDISVHAIEFLKLRMSWSEGPVWLNESCLFHFDNHLFFKSFSSHHRLPYGER